MIRLSKSCLSIQEKQAVMEVLDNEFLGMGPKVGEFEKQLSDFFERPTVCVVNGTAALHLALQVCGVGEGDEVLVPSLTYVASFQAISATGATPIACDVDPIECLLDINDANEKFTAKTKAIMPVHFTGGVGDLNQIYELANSKGIRVVEDAAHAFGTTYQGKRIGAFGDISCFSFDGIKNITSGEGGCIVSDDVNVIEKIKDARLLGVEKDSNKRLTGQRSWDFDVSEQGWRYHMSEIMAAIGLKQLERFGDFAAKRQNLCIRYTELLKDNKRIKTLPRDYETVVPHIFVVRITDLTEREKLRSILTQKGVQTGIHYQPNHILSFYREKTSRKLKNTEKLYPEILTLPLHPDMSTKDVEFVVNALEEVLEGHKI